jgi:hypothetical protein
VAGRDAENRVGDLLPGEVAGRDAENRVGDLLPGGVAGRDAEALLRAGVETFVEV